MPRARRRPALPPPVVEASAKRPSSSRWVMSPAADLLLVIGAPLLSALFVLPLSELTSPATVWAIVMAFGAAGHHLPGFLRTYGDRALFRRYRLRFLLAPPIFLAASIVFSLRNLHGLALFALVWSIWHG